MATTKQHHQHVTSRVAHNNCRECRADTERRFVATGPWRYEHVHDYLRYVRPLLNAIREGNDSIEARSWLREFRKALDRRINLKTGQPHWRKLCDSYQDRLRGMGHIHDADYLRRFAQTGASALT